MTHTVTSENRTRRPRHVRSPRQHTSSSIVEAMASEPARGGDVVRPVRPARRHQTSMGWGAAALSMLGLGRIGDTAK